MKRIIIAGATGNLGGKTVKHLLTKEVQIHALVRNQTEKNKKDGAERILCWGDRNQKMEFTHSDDIAAFTAGARLDDSTPRHL